MCVREQCLEVPKLDDSVTDIKQITGQYIKLCLLYFIHIKMQVSILMVIIMVVTLMIVLVTVPNFRKMVTFYDYLMNKGMLSNEKYFTTTITTNILVNGKNNYIQKYFRCLTPPPPPPLTIGITLSTPNTHLTWLQ